MKVIFGVLVVSVCVGMMQASQDVLSLLESRSQQSIEGFRDLNRKINIPDLSNAILVSDAAMIKNALQDVMVLNKTITTQIDSAIGFWNIYLDSVMMPTKEAYLMGQVMSSFLSTMRSLLLRSNIDQAMILSLLKKNIDREEKLLAQTVDAQSVQVKDYSVFDKRMRKLRL